MKPALDLARRFGSDGVKMPEAEDEDKLFASIDFTPVATVITNPRLPDNPIVAANDSFLKLTGYSRDEVIGRNCRFLSGPNTEQEGSRIIAEAVADDKPVITELLNYRRDGSSFRNAVMIAPIFDNEGEVAYYIGSQMDVTNGSAPALERRRRAAEQIKGLTPRQREVLEQMKLGYRNKQIAIRLGISEKTVKMHRASLLSKLDAATSADAVRIAVEADL